MGNSQNGWLIDSLKGQVHSYTEVKKEATFAAIPSKESVPIHRNTKYNRQGNWVESIHYNLNGYKNREKIKLRY